MNRDERNPEEMLDHVIDGIRNEDINAEALEQSRRRAWARIKHTAEAGAASAPLRIASCSDFRALLPDYLAGALPDGRRMLVEDHTHECVACRKALHELSQPVPSAPIAMPIRRPAPAWRKYAIAASLLVTAGLAGWRAYDAFAPAPGGRRAVVQAASGNVFRISNGALHPALAGTDVTETDTLRTGPGGHLLLKLEDGSNIEIGERAELGVSMSRSDTTLRLERGTVIVQAAKRTTGHLYVTSADCRVAVMGTIFAVNRGLKGSRVSVVEGSVQVEHGGKEVNLRPGDQVSTDASMSSVPIQDEIAWSRNFKDHLVLLNAIVDLKTKLDEIPLPGLRYGSRLMDFMPAETAIFASVPNVGQAVSDAHRLFQEQIRLSPVLQQWAGSNSKGSEEKMQRSIDTVRRFSEYIGDEIVVGAGVRNGSKGVMPVVLAEVHRAGLKEFIQTELPKLDGHKDGSGLLLIEGSAPIPERAKGELIVVLRGNYVIAGEDVPSLEEVARNIDGSGTKAFASSEFGRRLTAKLRGGTGILVGFDLQRVGGFEPGSTRLDPADRQEFLSLGADRVRYLIAEQKQSGAEAQRSAELSFAGARSGIASWLGAPAPIGGLGFVSPDPHMVAAAVLKKPDLLVDDFLAAKSDASRMFEEARKHLGIDVKQDFAALLGGEITFAIDGPLVPMPSWKLAMDVTEPERLQQTLEKVVNAANMAAQLVGRQGYTLTSETVNDNSGLFGQSGQLAYHLIRILDEAAFPEIHYVYTDGYLIMAPSRALLTKAIQTKRSGVTLARSDRFRALLPRDGRTNFSAIVYQNAGQWLGAVAGALGSEEQRAAGEVAAKVGPILVCAYGDTDRIEIVNKGSAWDVVLQSVLQPMLNHGTRAAVRSY